MPRSKVTFFKPEIGKALKVSREREDWMVDESLPALGSSLLGEKRLLGNGVRVA